MRMGRVPRGRTKLDLDGRCAARVGRTRMSSTGMKRAVGANECGQATVEAAFSIPVLFVLMLLLIQPGILLYDRMVMQAAAAEGCRLLATKTSASGDMDAGCEAFVRHRLSSVPSQACFHVHDGGCSWDISCSGDEGSSTVSVRISNAVRPLPLFDAGAALLGMVDGNGNLRVEVESSMPAQPAWVEKSPLGQNPSAWIGSWCS